MFYLNRLVQLISKISMLLSRFISRYNFSGRHFFIDFLRLPKPYPSDTTLSFQLNSNPTQTCLWLSANQCRFGLDTNLKGNLRQKWKNYHSIVGIGRGGGKSFNSSWASVWLLETFQTTFTLSFVSHFKSPNTKLGSPITQLDSPNTEPGSG